MEIGRLDPLRYPNLNFIAADSADELHGQLMKIEHLNMIISIYAVGNKHIAWFSSSTPVEKKRVVKKRTVKKKPKNTGA